jgi:hypothetical protein
MTRFIPTRSATTPDFRDWLKTNPQPDLQALIAEYDGYDKIPPQAWIDYDADVKDWNARRLNRDMW